MGVIYKLKQDVIDYVIGLKRLDANISCRKLAELASTHFQKEISKSSISAILKNSSLSSPVGRRGQKKFKDDTFKIPPHRKEQIFMNIPSQVLVGRPEPATPQQHKDQPLKEFMGCFFLKAAEYEMKKQGVLRFLCEKYASQPLQEKILNTTESFLYLPVFGKETESDFLSFRQNSCWLLHGLDQEPLDAHKRESLELLQKLEENKQQVLLDQSQIFSEGSFFRFSLEDGEVFCLDCRGNAVWEEKNVQSRFSSTLDKSFEFLSKNILINSSPLILRQAFQEAGFSLSFLNMMAAFENISGKRIKCVNLMTGQDDILVSFERPLQKKRFFMVGLFHIQGLAQKMLQEAGQKTELFTDPTTKQSYRYCVATTAFRLAGHTQASYNIVFLQAPHQESPQFGILTNMISDAQSAADIIALFLERWPHPLEGYALFATKKQSPAGQNDGLLSPLGLKGSDLAPQAPESSGSFLSQMAHTMLWQLHDYTRRHFFPQTMRQISWEQARQKLYRLPGRMIPTRNFFNVQIATDPRSVSCQELGQIVQSINESAISDFQGRRLIFSLIK